MKSIFRIITFTRELWPLYLTVSIFSVLVALLTQAIPLLTKAGIDHITAGLTEGSVSLWPVVIIVLAIFFSDLAQTFLSNIGGYYGDVLAARVRKFLSTRYYQHMMGLSQRYFDTELTGTIINRLNRGVNQITSYLQFVANNVLQLLVSTVISIGIVAYYSWPVALILVILFPTYAWLTTRSSGKWMNYQKKINQDTDVASGRFAESISQVKVVKSFTREGDEVRAYTRLMDRIIGTTRPQSKHWHTHDVMRRTVLALLFLAMYMIIFVGTAQGAYTLGTMVLLIQFIQLVRLPLFSLSFYVDNTQRAIADSRDYFKAMDETSEIIDAPNARRLKVGAGKIEFRDVSFGYENKKVLKGLNFEMAPGSKLALVGESGEGKTTITNLLLRLYEPQAGAIIIDGQDIRSVSQKSLREHIAVVFQEPALFSGTIYENIAYGRPRTTKEEVIAAAKAANAHEFIEKFERGYDTEIGERGLKLSGGQKQRIAIARALLKDAPILILDEATSSLDTRSERLVQAALERLMKGRTTLIIAHRLSTIESVDTIVTLRNGIADEIGAPAQLAQSGGIYDELLNLQHRGGAADKKRLKRFELTG